MQVIEYYSGFRLFYLKVLFKSSILKLLTARLHKKKILQIWNGIQMDPIEKNVRKIVVGRGLKYLSLHKMLLADTVFPCCLFILAVLEGLKPV